MTHVQRAARGLLLGLTAALLLATAVSTTSARNLSTSTQPIRSTWSRLEFASELVTVRCLVTLEGSFHSRTIAKIINSLIGTVTRANIKEETCTNGRARPKNLPWHILYGGFTGNLPTIGAVLIKIGRFRYEVIVNGFCTGDYGAAEDLLAGNASLAGGGVTSLSTIEGSNIARRVTGTGVCPPSGRMVAAAAESVVTALESTARITLTLI